MHADDVDPADLDSAHLALRLLGPMELVVAGRSLPLPRSKKTRALLAYLALNERAHRRDRLCALLWDVTDDPRGALRWSLSRLRQVLGAEAQRIVAGRDEVAWRAEGMAIDASALARLQRSDFATSDTATLERAVAWYRGEFLEGLELPDFLDFSAWCIEQREQARRCHAALLTELVARHREAPARALQFARQRVQVEVFDLEAHRALLNLLLKLGHVAEAQQRFEHAQRLFRQVSAADAIAFDQAWRALRSATAEAPAASATPASVRAEPQFDSASLPGAGVPAFVGRQATLARLKAMLDDVRQDGETRLVLVTGEPGVGKSRLAEQLCAAADALGFVVVAGRAFEAESSRPFGPWADALELNVQQEVTEAHPSSRESLFEMLRARLETRVAKGRASMLLLDDLQWFDRNSTELLHYLVRTGPGRTGLVLMLARGGELPDNEAAVRLLRSLRREYAVQHIELEPLTREEIEALVGREAGVDGRHVHEVSAGNPLYALEFVRAQREGLAGPPATLMQLVRDRIAKLPERAADVLRWSAVLGRAIQPARLEELTALAAEELVDALERLEQSSLLRIDTTRTSDRYAFSHELIREAVYGELSLPRRRLMHRKVARCLEPQAADPAVAAELAHHAGLAGEAELGVRACIVAGHHALRVFANEDAEALARRGLRLVEEVDEPRRIESTLDLLQVLYTARTPDGEQAAERLRGLAERALDFGLTRAARQGFQMVSYLRWEHSSMADAHANILQAERVSRLAEPGERAVALAQAARCLVLLERNLPQAEAFALEADAVRRRDGKTSAAVSFALGMLAAHRGDTAGAVEAFVEARQLARQQGEHLAEFGALEHHVMLELDDGNHAYAMVLAADLADLGCRVRPGAELHAGRALLALARLHGGIVPDDSELAQAVEAVRQADAKYELSYLLTRWAEHELAAGRLDTSRDIATQALEVAQAIGRCSEQAHALVTLAAVAQRARRPAESRRQRALLKSLEANDLSARSRRRVASLAAGDGPGR
ncbi:AAA family ATPase [uncultured Piscinibacter sp.]|uniref:ATP-binding protein n=1 Tax=uncultured Piscinibacter sp. TaxID=1131835 RepID=UPI0026285E7C|nr:AAA family ATPase [uncultured Piscinibacter sp.]